MQEIFTVFEIAKICKCSPPAVSRWVDSGRLKAHWVPARGHDSGRRVMRDDLVIFLEKSGYAESTKSVAEFLREAKSDN